MTRRVKTPAIIAVPLLAALAAAAAFSAASITWRAGERGGQPVGEVLVGSTVVIDLLTAQGPYSPEERAAIVADRLQAAMATAPTAESVEVRAIAGGEGIYIGSQLMVTVSDPEAEAHGTTRSALAGFWRDNLVAALSLPQAPPAEAPSSQPAETAAPAEPTPAAQPASTGEVDWTGAAQKWVPIFSLESEGAYIGAAQIAGPSAQVEKVKGVAELRLNFENLGRIYAYIPTASINVTKLDRVQGVSVWATGDLRLVGF